MNDTKQAESWVEGFVKAAEAQGISREQLPQLLKIAERRALEARFPEQFETGYKEAMEKSAVIGGLWDFISKPFRSQDQRALIKKRRRQDWGNKGGFGKVLSSIWNPVAAIRADEGQVQLDLENKLKAIDQDPGVYSRLHRQQIEKSKKWQDAVSGGEGNRRGRGYYNRPAPHGYWGRDN